MTSYKSYRFPDATLPSFVISHLSGCAKNLSVDFIELGSNDWDAIKRSGLRVLSKIFDPLIIVRNVDKIQRCEIEYDDFTFRVDYAGSKFNSDGTRVERPGIYSVILIIPKCSEIIDAKDRAYRLTKSMDVNHVGFTFSDSGQVAHCTSDVKLPQLIKIMDEIVQGKGFPKSGKSIMEYGSPQHSVDDHFGFRTKYYCNYWSLLTSRSNMHELIIGIDQLFDNIKLEVVSIRSCPLEYLSKNGLFSRPTGDNYIGIDRYKAGFKLNVSIEQYRDDDILVREISPLIKRILKEIKFLLINLIVEYSPNESLHWTAK